MKKARWTSITIMLALVAVASMQGADRIKIKGGRDIFKPSEVTVRGDYVKFDVNRISTFIRNNGSFNRDPGTGNAGFEWPKGTGNTANYASGIWLGGKVGGIARVAVAEYSYEFDAGPIATGVNADDQRWRVYKIKRGDNASNSSDYADWPFDDGAPAVKNSAGGDSLDGTHRIPELTGDMTVWCVFNDNNAQLHTNMNTGPLGLEVQLTAFAYNRSDALGNTIYYRWKIINKGGNTIDPAFITIWTDIDLGDSGDDYDGCDTTNGIGFTYNEKAIDGVYGATVPATGFDFLQVPLVPSPGDTAVFPDGRKFPGKTFINGGRMTSFLKYSNDATDLGNPNNGQEVLNYMQGLTRSGLQILDDLGRPARYMFPGDPNKAYDARTNWIEQGAGGDRRFMMSAGPFTMAPGDTQEIVAGNLIAQGTDYHNSVTALINADKAVQKAYDLNFKLPPPPQAPEVIGAAFDRSIVLSWGENDALASEIEATSTFDPIAAAGGAAKTSYDFTGYVVYQVANPSGDNPKVVATYSKNSLDIFDDVFDPSQGGKVNKIVKFHGDKPPQRTIKMTQDKYSGGPFLNNKDYYFVVTSFTYNEESVPKTLESSFNVVIVRPTKLPGARLTASYSDTILSVVHNTGISEAKIVPKVIDPSKLTGHNYQITADTTGGSKVGWILRDATLNTEVLRSANLGPGGGGTNYSWPEKDGIQWQVYDVESRPNPDSSSFTGGSWLQSGNRWDHTPPAVIDPTDAGTWVITTGYDLPNFLGHMNPGFDPAHATPMEIRFGPSETQNAYRMRRAGGVGTAYVIQATAPFVSVPFTVWDMSNPASPRQLTVAWRDQDNSQTYNPGADDGVEVVFIYYRTYDANGNQWLYQNAAGHVAADWSDVNTIGANADIMYGMSAAVVAGHTFGETASKITVIPFKVLQPADLYTVTSPAAPTKTADLAKQDVNNILAVPNPYFGTNAYEKNQFNRVVRFTNLPPAAKLRIFNLAGELVRVLDKNDNMTTTDWDLTNKNNLPVGSGIYIVHIDMPNLGAKVLKVAVIMSEERLDNF